jgi:hypothetical protein
MQLFRRNEKTKYPKSYFYSAVNKLSLYKSSNLDDSEIIDISPFEKDKYLGTLDIAHQIAGFDDSDISQITSASPNSQANLIKQKLRKKPTSIFNLIKKSTQFTRITPIKINNFTFKSKNSGAIQDNQIPQTININITSQKLAKWKKSLKVYFSNKLTTGEKKDLIKSKLGHITESQGVHNIGHLSTFMVESEFYYDSKNQLFDSAKPLKILGFCYPDFRYRTFNGDSYSFWADPQLAKFWDITHDSSTGSIVYKINEAELKAQIYHTLQINLLAVIEEAIKTNTKLPFIINIPSAFLAYLEDEHKYLIKKTIAQTFISLKKIHSLSIFDHISEFIVVAPNAWNSEVDKVRGAESITEIFKNPKDYHTATHLVDADILDIAQQLHDHRGIICPVPIMLNPSYPIGCQYLEPNLDITAFDEMLGRNTGGVPRAIYENGVVRITANQGLALRDVKNDPVFKTFQHSNFKEQEITLDDGSTKSFYVDNASITEFQNKDQSESLQVARTEIPVSDGIKLNFFQHSFTYDKSKNKFEIPQIIDTAPIFTCAIKEAVKGLDCFENFESDISHGGNLFYILTFANLHQGVGNKIEELKDYLVNKRQMTQGTEDFDKFINQAQTLSARFQAKMREQGIMTGRYQPANIVGARLHRMATKENILQIMQGTKCHEISNLEAYFNSLKSKHEKSIVEAKPEVAPPDLLELSGERAPSPSPAQAKASSKPVSFMISAIRSVGRAFSRSTGGGKQDLNSHN